MQSQFCNKYEKRIVIFIDILGFSNLVKNTDLDNLRKEENKEKARKNLENLIAALIFINNEISKIKNSKIASIQLSQFSDSLVISILESSDDLILIFYYLKSLQINLLNNYKILIRGGIVNGKIIHNEKMLLGPAMVDAYTLESKCANSPRIVVMPSVVKMYERYLKENEVLDDEKVLGKDYDGTFYVDYFNNISDDYDIDKMEYYNKIDEIIQGNSRSKDVSIKIKYYWMREKLKNTDYFKNKNLMNIKN